MDLKTFLLARIAQDEQNAGRYVSVYSDGDFASLFRRVLTESAAKRAVLADRERIDRNASDSEWAMGYSDANYSALRALAAVYSDHPDYQSEWAQEASQA